LLMLSRHAATIGYNFFTIPGGHGAFPPCSCGTIGLRLNFSKNGVGRNFASGAIASLVIFYLLGIRGQRLGLPFFHNFTLVFGRFLGVFIGVLAPRRVLKHVHPTRERIEMRENFLKLLACHGRFFGVGALLCVRRLHRFVYFFCTFHFTNFNTSSWLTILGCR
jgi:hypothetical protein